MKNYLHTKLQILEVTLGLGNDKGDTKEKWDGLLLKI